MRVLVTRPIEDAERTAAALREHGHDAILSPLLEIRFLDGPGISLDGVQAVLATSANGVRALARRNQRRDLPAFAVGPQTALAARAAGFADVRDAGGNADALTETVSRWLDPREGSLLHASGRHRKDNLAAALEASGFTVRTEFLYEAVPATGLSPDAQAAFGAGELDAVMLFSPRSAATFAAIVQRNGLSSPCRNLVALCISRETDAALAPLSFRENRVAKRPNQDSMLDLLGQR
ncbi:MAG TPA: uroporphyrinogen-III synthase [Rhizomicrobium sp.]|jgi:uroporphyrinogen-III synthase